MIYRWLFGITFLIALWTGGAATALAQNPDLKEALKLDRQGFFAESIGFWKKFLQSQPQENLHVYAQIKLTIAYSKTGNFSEAVKTAKDLALVYPGHYDVQFNLGNMLGATHDYAGAVQAYRKAAAIKPDQGLAYVGEGVSLFGDQRSEESLKVLRRVRKLFKDQKNIDWYRNVRIMIGQIKGFALYPHNFSDLWRTNNLKKVRETYVSTVFTVFEKGLNL